MPRSRRPSSLAVRSRRVFRAQYRLLLETVLLERAEADLAARQPARHGLRGRREERRVAVLRAAVEQHRTDLTRRELWLSADERRPTHLAPEDLLARLERYVDLGTAPPAAVAPAAGAAQERRVVVGRAALAGSAVAWALTAAELSLHGMGNHPALIVAEACAIVLSPLAVILSAKRRDS